MDAAIEIRPRAAPQAHRLVWFAVVTALAGALTIVSFEGFTQGSSIEDLSGDAVAPIMPTAPSVVCRSAISAACARSAANISGVPSAWIQAPAGFQLAEFFASGAASGAARSQALFLPQQGGSSQISLESAAHLQPRLAATQTVTAGSDSATLSELTVAGSVVEAQLLWTHAGSSYSLLWIGAPVDTKALIAEWNQVRYVSPSKH